MSVQITDKKSKKTKKKLVTQWINEPLISLDSNIKRYYQRAYYCSSVLEQSGDTVSTRYCNSRTCLTCNGIRTAMYIKNYGEQVFSLLEPQFVTLTAKTIWCTDWETLRYEIERREGVWRKIYKNAFKIKIKLVGLKAMEITARPDQFYHIHFHFIISGAKEAEWVKTQWLNHFTDALPKLQVIKPLTTRDGLLEVFKYGTKFADREKKLVNGKVITVYKKVEPERTDIIIQALQKKRLISTFGGIRRVKDDDVNEVVQKMSIEDLVAEEQRTWKWVNECDWFATDNGEKFSDFVPSKDFKRVFKGS